MAPSKASTTKFEWLPDDPTAFAPIMLWKSPCITTWRDSRNQNLPTDSAEEAKLLWRVCSNHVDALGHADTHRKLPPIIGLRCPRRISEAGTRGYRMTELLENGIQQ